MPSPCYYHPDAPATGNCVQCGVPICDACTDRINQKPVCKNCVAVVRARVERELASAPTGYAPPAVGGQTQINHGSYGIGNAPAAGLTSYPATPTAAPNAGKVAIGIVVALIIGVIGCIAVEKFELFAPLSLSLLYVLVGYAIGWGLHKITGSGGMKMAVIAVCVMFVSLVVSHLVLVQDELSQAIADHKVGTDLTFNDALVPVLSSQGFVHWLFVAFGLYACFKGMMRRQ